MLEGSSSEWSMGEGSRRILEYSYRAHVHISEFQPLAVSLVQKIHRFSTSGASNFPPKTKMKRLEWQPQSKSAK
jgi:hypothetical protein